MPSRVLQGSCCVERCCENRSGDISPLSYQFIKKSNMNALTISQLLDSIKTIQIKIKDVKKGDIITQLTTKLDSTILQMPWFVSKIKKRKFNITFYDQYNSSIELPINIARPDEIERTNCVYIIPRTFLKSYKE
jgi:hypothetical protein